MSTPTLRGMFARCRREGRTAVMADVKLRSPRDGVLIPQHRVSDHVTALLSGGVDALSTPTESQHFGGSIDVAQEIAALSSVPVLRKEFFSSVEQIDETLTHGVRAVQLSLSVVHDRGLLRAMSQRADELAIEVVYGVHGRAQIDEALDLGACVLGLNNRDISVLELDGGTVAQTEMLMATIPADVFVISESSMTAPRDVARAAAAGADAVLLGTALAVTKDLAGTLAAVRAAASRRIVATSGRDRVA